MFYAGGPVFACFVLNAPEPANPFLSAEKEYKNPVSLIIPNTQLELSPSLTPTWNTPTPQKRSLLPGGLEVWESFRLLQGSQTRSVFSFLVVETWLSARVGGVLLSSAHAQGSPACTAPGVTQSQRRRSTAVSQLSRPQGGSELPISDSGFCAAEPP